MIHREYGEATTLECRAESNELTDKQKRCKDILWILKCHKKPMTAMEIAYLLNNYGLSRFERNAAAPRLTEMCQMGIVEPVGKKKDKWSNRMVTCYQIRSEVNG